MSTISARHYEEALRDWLGKRVVFRDGWRDRTSAGGFDAHGVLHHWTAMSGRTVSEALQERVLAAGRPGLPGPLCHLSPRRSGIVAVIAGPHANANHAGNGDAAVWRRVLAGRFDGSPRPIADAIDGNERLYGFEYQYHPDDGPMPDEQVEAGILAAAALAEAHGWGPNEAAGSNLDHYEWTRRKPDRNVQNLADRTRAGVRAALINGRNQEDDMSAQDVITALNTDDGREAIRKAVAPEVRRLMGDVVDLPEGGTVMMKTAMERVLRELAAIRGGDALAAKIAEALGDSADYATVRQAVEDVLRQGVNPGK